MFPGNKKSLGTAVVALLLTLSGIGHAEVHLETSRIWRRARTIAPGQQVWSLQSLYQNSNDHFSADGKLEPLGQNYLRSVTWGQLLNSESAPGRVDLRGYMQEKKIGESDIAAQSTYDISREELGFEANWAYGLTSSWMIGVRMPLTLRTTRVREHIEMSSMLSSQAGQKSHSAMRLQTADLSQYVRSLAAAQLANSGYDQIPQEKQSWDWGDISLMSQENVYTSYHWCWSWQQTLKFPTAQNPSIADFIQTSNDEGQVDAGLTSLLDYRTGRWVAGFRFGYVAQLPDTTRMRIPSTTPDAQVGPSVHRDLGDWMWSSLDAEFKLARRWEVSAEHAILSKSRDKYSGDEISSAAAQTLANNSDQQLQQSRLGVLYRMGSEGIRAGVLNRWSTAVDFTYPWIGRNSTDASQVSVEMMTYF